MSRGPVIGTRQQDLARSRTEARRRVSLLGVLISILAIGTLGYVVIEDWSVLDALYMTIITISTVGFREVGPLSPAGQVFTIILVMSGVIFIAYGVRNMIEFFVGGSLTGLYRRRAVRRQLEQLQGHYIVCGFGRVGESVAREFAENRAPFVVVDVDPEGIERMEAEGFLCVLGDASEDAVLEEAGIERARGLVAAVDSDADNIFVTLSARALNPRLLIVARSNSEEAISKLHKAGADHVISPYGISGKKMATLLMRPMVSDYLDVVTGRGEIEFRLEEFALNGTCEIVGRSIKDLDVRRTTGATILAVRQGRSGRFDTNPSPELVLRDDDVIIAIGTPGDIAKLEELFACTLPPLAREWYETKE